MRRGTGLAILAAMVWLGFGFGAFAQGKGSLSVPVRESEKATAMVVDQVMLYRASHALVIGIDNYTNGWPRLSMAVEDARIVAEALKGHGFDVTLKTDLKSAELEQVLREFFIVKGENPEARLFFWYAGHGHTASNEGLLVPADAPAGDLGTRFVLSALPMRRFGEYVRLAKSKHIFAVFDSCFAGTIFDAQRALPPQAITRATQLPVRQFLTSGDATQQVNDNGTFRDLFLRALRGEEKADANGDGYVTATEIGLFITDRVTNLTKARQTPRYGKLLDKDLDRGDFVFRIPSPARSQPTAALPVAPPAAQQADQSAFELAFWDSIKSSTNPADYRAYLEAYPDGRFVPLARTRAAPAAPASQPPAEKPRAAALPPEATRSESPPGVKIEPIESEYITLGQANVREEPRPTSRRIATLPRGKPVMVAGKVAGENWYLVEDEGKQLGYVFGDVLESAAAAAARREEPQRKAAEERARQEADAERNRVAALEEQRRREDGERKAAEEKARREAEAERQRVATLERQRQQEQAARRGTEEPARPPVAPSPPARQQQSTAVAPSPPATRPPAQPAVGLPPAPPKPGQTFKDCDLCPEMVVVPAGSFEMGSPQAETTRETVPAQLAGRERPQHRVAIAKPFAVGKHEVTREQYERFAADTGRAAGEGCSVWARTEWKKDLGKSWRDPGFVQPPRDPAVCVTWDDAKAYAEWLSRKTGKGYRLLSEAEWEYAARAGTTTARPWGDAIDRGHANCAGCGTLWDNWRTAPFASFAANPFGLHDMLGNVWEWVEDCANETYDKAPADGSAWVTGDCSRRVLRGGSWTSASRLVRSAQRGRNVPGLRSNDVGFRLAREL